jgi:NTP pyrophosphatase (non-canonical NTP hydrolase)
MSTQTNSVHGPKMPLDEYIFHTGNTDAPLNFDFDAANPMHYALGLVTEAGEIADIFKKHFAYDKPVDPQHVKEEIGDLMWYIARMCEWYNFDLENIMFENIAKLKKRFPDKFDADRAINRDKVAENEVLRKDDAHS